MFSNRISAACSTINRELQNIHRLKTLLMEYKNQGTHVQKLFIHINCIIVPREVKFMTDRLKVKDEQNEIVSDWKFAAMVIDRSLSKANIFTKIHFHFHLPSLPFTLTSIHFHLHSHLLFSECAWLFSQRSLWQQQPLSCSQRLTLWSDNFHQWSHKSDKNRSRKKSLKQHQQQKNCNNSRNNSHESGISFCVSVEGAKLINLELSPLLVRQVGLD